MILINRLTCAADVSIAMLIAIAISVLHQFNPTIQSLLIVVAEIATEKRRARDYFDREFNLHGHIELSGSRPEAYRLPSS